MAYSNSGDGPVVEVVNGAGRSEFLLVCEHASSHIPPRFAGLGLQPQALTSHIAWDPGAADVAAHLAAGLDAPLVRSNVSRLIYDCNRPPEAPDAIPGKSEIYEIPGNRDLSEAQRVERVALYYRPFEAVVEATIGTRVVPPVLVTIHSYTPVFKGQRRTVEVGILHDADRRLADAILAVATGFDIRRNEPYGPADGVTHTLRRHGLANGLLNVMIEIRNDLIATPTACREMALHLKSWLEAAVHSFDADAGEKVRA